MLAFLLTIMKPVLAALLLIVFAFHENDSQPTSSRSERLTDGANTSVVNFSLDFLNNTIDVSEDHNPPVRQIITIVNGTLKHDVFALDDVLREIEDSDTEVAILGIAGPARKGKSFLMNLFLQCLEYFGGRSITMSNPEAWLRDIDKSKGFHFKAGLRRDTTGVRIFSRPFIITRPNGKKLAILLMDTQGLYDSSTSSDDNVRLFSLAALLSSNLMYNTVGNINSDELLKLKTFTDYAVTSSQLINGTKPFQKLTFVIRDTTLTQSLGYTGGQEIIGEFMSDSDERSDEVRAVTKNLNDSFSSIDAFALPPPGDQVTRPNYNGSISLISPKFLEHVQEFVVSTINSLQARAPLVIPLTKSTVSSYFSHVIETLNKQMSPKELMLLKERTLMIGTFRKMEQSIRVYEEEMGNWISRHNDSYFLSRSMNQIMHDVDAADHEASEKILEDFSHQPLAYSIFEQGVNNTVSKDGMQTLRDTLATRYHQMRPQMQALIEKRMNEAISRQRAAAAAAVDVDVQPVDVPLTPVLPDVQPLIETRDSAGDNELPDEATERRRKIEERIKWQESERKFKEERERHERWMECMNRKERQIREMTFWDKLADMFKSLLNWTTGNQPQRKISPGDQCRLETM